MAICWISFRIAERTVGNKTGDQRRRALEEAVEEISSTFWHETTSFIVFDTETDFNSAARTFKSKISVDYDLFLMRKMDTKKAIICGSNDDDDIFELMDYLETI